MLESQGENNSGILRRWGEQTGAKTEDTADGVLTVASAVKRKTLALTPPYNSELSILSEKCLLISPGVA